MFLMKDGHINFKSPYIDLGSTLTEQSNGKQTRSTPVLMCIVGLAAYLRGSNEGDVENDCC